MNPDLKNEGKVENRAGKIQEKIGEIEKTRAEAYGSLSKQLESLALAQT
jgi:uncharacterized protein YjbJ (UPF0337 family)